MPAKSESVGFKLIRRALKQLVGETSLRAAAKEVGMSTSGLWSFLEGGEPQRSTSKKLQHWFVSKGQHRVSEPVNRELAEAALHLLLQEWPILAREKATGQIIRAIAELSDSDQLPRPQWLKAFGEHIREKPKPSFERWIELYEPDAPNPFWRLKKDPAFSHIADEVWRTMEIKMKRKSQKTIKMPA